MSTSEFSYHDGVSLRLDGDTARIRHPRELEYPSSALAAAQREAAQHGFVNVQFACDDDSDILIMSKDHSQQIA